LVFVLEPFNINRGIERSIFIVIGEKRQLLILPLLTLGGAIGVWAIKKLRLCFRMCGISDLSIYFKWLCLWWSLRLF